MPPPIQWRWEHADICPLSGVRGPQSWKNVGLHTNSVCIFFPVFWRVHFLSEVLSVCKVLDGGVTPSPRYGEKTGLAAKPIFLRTRCRSSTFHPTNFLWERSWAIFSRKIFWQHPKKNLSSNLTKYHAINKLEPIISKRPGYWELNLSGWNEFHFFVL